MSNANRNAAESAYSRAHEALCDGDFSKARRALDDLDLLAREGFVPADMLSAPFGCPAHVVERVSAHNCRVLAL